MSAPRPHRHHCDFCSRDLAGSELLFRADRGGLPPAVCSDCVDWFADVAKLYRADPEAAGRAVAAHNALIEQGQ